MWIETQEGELINLDTGTQVIIREPKNENRGWWIILNHSEMGASRICAEYASEGKAREVFESFKNKLRRNGEKIFKFEGDVENVENGNETAGKI